ncbi:MAG: hypothetical protein J6Y01_04050 [Spirochaetales bacterium]|nr:hypothetical protein [Spirochaetales bacterium]
MKTKTVFLFSLIFLCFLVSCDPDSPFAPECITTTTTMPPTDWTVMIYSAGDCNLSYYLLNDLAEIKNGTNNNMTVIALSDTNYNQNSNFCEAYKGTRLYQIYNGIARRLNGGDILPEITFYEDVNLNTGDADTFCRFVKYCKTYYPAKKYAVFVGGHGLGTYEEKNVSRSSGEPLKAMAIDYSSSSDWIFTAELTDAFENDEPIDLLVLDCCNMGFAEVAYQYRPNNGSFNTKYMLASLQQQISEGLCYDTIFANVTPTMSAADFGKLILQKQKEYIISVTGIDDDPSSDIVTTNEIWSWSFSEIQSMALYDCTKIESLKNAIDEAVPFLIGSNGLSLIQNAAAQACGYWNHSSTTNSNDFMYDIYNLFDYMANTTSDDISDTARSAFAKVRNLADEVVVSSFLQREPHTVYTYPFENGKCGLAIFSPFYQYLWTQNLSYNAIEITAADGISGYGNYAWCIDGCEPNNNEPENWFELLDSWFDINNNESGGRNHYQY